MKMSYTFPVVGSATIGPWMLLNVEFPVTSPRPVSGDPLGRHVCPSSVDFQLRMIELFWESW